MGENIKELLNEEIAAEIPLELLQQLLWLFEQHQRQ